MSTPEHRENAIQETRNRSTTDNDASHSDQATDTHYVEGVCRREAAQLYERAHFHHIIHDINVPDHDPHSLAQRLQSHFSGNDLMPSIERLYGSTRPSESSMLEQRLTPGLADEPFPLFARIAMETAGIQVGSLESIDKRKSRAMGAVQTMHRELGPAR